MSNCLTGMPRLYLIHVARIQVVDSYMYLVYTRL